MEMVKVYKKSVYYIMRSRVSLCSIKYAHTHLKLKHAKFQQRGRAFTTAGLPQLTVAVDLDECMVHSRFLEFHESNPLQVDYRQAEFRPQHVKEVNSFECTLPLGEITVIVNKRPFLDHFLQEVSDEYRCISFTASDKQYASEVLDHLDPGHHFFHERLYKESCRHVKGVALKDLSVISEDLSRVVLIENSYKAILANPDNSILVNPFFDNPKDTALEEALGVLRELEGEPDVRPYLRERYQYARVYRAEIAALFRAEGAAAALPSP